MLTAVVGVTSMSTAHSAPVDYDTYEAAYFKALDQDIKKSRGGTTAYHSEFTRNGIVHTASYRSGQELYTWNWLIEGRFSAAGRTHDLICVKATRCWLRSDGSRAWKRLPGRVIDGRANEDSKASIPFVYLADATSWDITGNSFTETYQLTNPAASLVLQETFSQTGITERMIMTSPDGQVLYEGTLSRSDGRRVKVKPPKEVSPVQDVCFRLFYAEGEWAIGTPTPNGDCQLDPSS